MGNIQLFIAMSVDGYIARKNGSIDWLDDIPNPEGLDFGYNTFISDIGTVVMGRKTYETVVGFDVDWPYSDFKCYVISKNTQTVLSTPNTELITTISEDTLSKIKANSLKDIWVVGRSEIIS
ncbi:MAG: dihydrofolate reductase [Bacteroidia bacterium]|jgi:dihydrofolate reductase